MPRRSRFPADGGSGWRLPRRWCRIPTCCCSTSRPIILIWPALSGWRRCSRARPSPAWWSAMTATFSKMSRPRWLRTEPRLSRRHAARSAGITASFWKRRKSSSTRRPSGRSRSRTASRRKWSGCAADPRRALQSQKRASTRPMNSSANWAECRRGPDCDRRDRFRRDGAADEAAGRVHRCDYSVDGDRKLFSGLNFPITAGMRVGLVGPNGSGKTTLLRLLRGEIEPESGEIKRANLLRTSTSIRTACWTETRRCGARSRRTATRWFTRAA